MRTIILVKIIIFVFVVIWQSPIFAQVAPNPPEITGVTVLVDGTVKINWLTEPAAEGYIIYRSKIYDNEGDRNPIDTLTTINEYIDLNVDARNKSVGYFMSSFIMDNGKVVNGIAGDWHYTIFLNPVIFDSCKNTNTLVWSNYIGWDPAYYNVYRDENLTPIKDGLNDTTFADNITPGNNHSYYVKAISSKNSSIKSESNRVNKATTELINPDENLFYISHIENQDNTINFLVSTDNQADVLGYQLMVGESESNFSLATFIEKGTNPTHSFTHSSNIQPLFYKVNALGVCNVSVAETQMVKPIVLTSPGYDETQVTLEWNNSFIDEMDAFTVKAKVDNGTESIIETLTGTTATYNFADIGNENAEFYYFAISSTDINANSSLSNRLLVTRIAKVVAPNAFTPNGDSLNDYFGPFYDQNDTENSYIKNAVVVEFKLVIYDKYGGKVFESDKSNYRWDGEFLGKSVAEGGYHYYLWYKTAQLKTYEQSGTINVVYP